MGENSLDNSVGKVMLCLGGSQSGDSIWDGQAISPHEGHILTGEIFKAKLLLKNNVLAGRN